jgi:hypothetical protein
MPENAELDLTEHDPDPEGPPPVVLERGAVLQDELQPVSGTVAVDIGESGGDADRDVAVSLALSDDENDTLEDIASRRGTARDAVLHEAIATLRQFEQAMDDGVRLLVQGGDGSVRELVHR